MRTKQLSTKSKGIWFLKFWRKLKWTIYCTISLMKSTSEMWRTSTKSSWKRLCSCITSSQLLPKIRSKKFLKRLYGHFWVNWRVALAALQNEINTTKTLLKQKRSTSSVCKNTLIIREEWHDAQVSQCLRIYPLLRLHHFRLRNSSPLDEGGRLEKSCQWSQAAWYKRSQWNLQQNLQGVEGL